MPSRVVRGEIVRSDSLSKVSLGASLTFHNLIVAVDDYGRLDARPGTLKADLFPVRDDVSADQVLEWVRELAALDDPPVRIYEVNGRHFVQLVNWEQHRGRGRRASESKYPDPPESQDATEGIRGDPRISWESPGDPPEGRGTRDVGRRTRDEGRGVWSAPDGAPPSDFLERLRPESVDGFGAQLQGESFYGAMGDPGANPYGNHYEPIDVAIWHMWQFALKGLDQQKPRGLKAAIKNRWGRSATYVNEVVEARRWHGRLICERNMELREAEGEDPEFEAKLKQTLKRVEEAVRIG